MVEGECKEKHANKRYERGKFTMGAMTCLGDPMDLKNSHPLSLEGKVCSARHFATAAALRFSASSFALLVMISLLFFVVGVSVSL